VATDVAARGLGEHFLWLFMLSPHYHLNDICLLTVCKPVKLCRESAVLSLLVSTHNAVKSEHIEVLIWMIVIGLFKFSIFLFYVASILCK